MILPEIIRCGHTGLCVQSIAQIQIPRLSEEDIKELKQEIEALHIAL